MGGLPFYSLSSKLNLDRRNEMTVDLSSTWNPTIRGLSPCCTKASPLVDSIVNSFIVPDFSRTCNWRKQVQHRLTGLKVFFPTGCCPTAQNILQRYLFLEKVIYVKLWLEWKIEGEWSDFIWVQLMYRSADLTRWTTQKNAIPFSCSKKNCSTSSFHNLEDLLK